MPLNPCWVRPLNPHCIPRPTHCAFDTRRRRRGDEPRGQEVLAAVLVGEDRGSLGSDYDGSGDAPFDAAHLVALTQALMDAGLTDDQIAKVMGGNMMRYLRETLPGDET